MKVSIPNPCAAGWDNMSPSGNDRYCSSCEKIVVDFTKMSNEEIKHYFETYAEQKTCGHFYSSQLEQKQYGRSAQLVLLWYRKSKENIRSKVPRIAALFVLGSVLTLMGCSSPNEEVEGKAVTGDSISMSAIDTNSTSKTVQNDSLNNAHSSPKK